MLRQERKFVSFRECHHRNHRKEPIQRYVLNANDNDEQLTRKSTRCFSFVVGDWRQPVSTNLSTLTQFLARCDVSHSLIFPFSQHCDSLLTVRQFANSRTHMTSRFSSGTQFSWDKNATLRTRNFCSDHRVASWRISSRERSLISSDTEYREGFQRL